MDPSTILQWNCRSINSKKIDIYHLINLYKPVIIAIQETWLKPGYNFKVSQYLCVREDRTDGYAGVALLVHNTIPFDHIPIANHSIDFSIIAVSINKICFVSVYIPHPTSSIFDEIEVIISQLPKPVLILGDFNAQHQAWGSTNSSYYGARILDILDSNNFCILNTGVATRRTQPHEGISAPDLSLTTPGLASLLTWKTLSSTYDSDHYPILITLPKKLVRTKFRRPPRLKYKICNDIDSDRWTTFREHVAKKVSSLPHIKKNNHSVCADALALAMIEAANQTFLIKKSINNIPSPPWWDSECSAAVKERKKS